MQHRLIFVPAGIIFGTILAFGVNLMAEDSELDTGPRVFPYNGVLEFNGEAVNDNVDLQFTLTDEGDCVFEEAHDNVAVFAGRFTTNIGAIVGGVPTCVFDADEIYIQVAVREADEEGQYTALLGQQRFAYWAAEGSDFKVDGDANILGNANVGGALSIGGSISDPDSAVVVDDGIIITGDATIRGSIKDNTGDVTIDDSLDVTGSIDAQDSIFSSTGDVTINDNLDIRGSIQDTNGSVIIDDSLTVTGNLSVTGTLLTKTTGTLTVTRGNVAGGAEIANRNSRTFCTAFTRLQPRNSGNDRVTGHCTVITNAGNGVSKYQVSAFLGDESSETSMTCHWECLSW